MNKKLVKNRRLVISSVFAIYIVGTMIGMATNAHSITTKNSVAVLTPAANVSEHVQYAKNL
jgi:hypothetical protein